MSFYNEIERYADFPFESFFADVTETDIYKVLGKDRLNAIDYLTLLSPKAEVHIETIAQKAHGLTVQHFGRTMLLYTPIYVANFCVNQCVYCGFQAKNAMPRKKLSPDEVAAEAEIIAASGLKHILLLTGESRHHSSVDYIADCVEVLKRYFTSISIEIYPLDTDEYAKLIAAGVDGLTIYQETYDRDTYADIHPAGPKRDYRYRLEAPDRSCQAGMRAVNVGALLGLSDWRKDAFITGLHADYLQRTYPDAEVSISPPRMRPHLGDGFQPSCAVSDKNLVQYITAFRMFMPRGGVTVSTRERPELRNHLVQLGVTKMSAGVSTSVGGRVKANSTSQFEIADERSVLEMAEMLYGRGYQPLYKDWQTL